MICHLRYIFLWIFLIPQPTDGGSVTWHEPTPTKTTSNPNEKLSPGIVRRYEGFSLTLNWSYNLTAGLLLGVIRFNNDRIVRLNADGSADPVETKFQERFSVSSTPGSASLFISPVTVADDMSFGEFRCELIDSWLDTWKRAIQVQVIVPLNITRIRGELTVLEGSNLQLICEASSRVEPNITWTKEKPGNQGNTGVVQEGKVLTITNINRSDAGTFTCTAYNGFSKPENQTVYVVVTCTIGIIVGAVFGSVATPAVAGVLVWWTCRKKRCNTKGTEEVVMSRRTFGNSSNEKRESTNTAVELPNSSQSHYMALDDRARSQVMADASPLSNEQISEYASLDPYTRSFEIPREHVTIKQIVGKGAFGQVAKATANNLQGRAKKTLVAVKMLLENASESDKKNLLSELELMKQLKPHPYVIKLLGCVTKSEPLLVLIEYVPFGDLLGYLRKSRGLNDTYYKDPDIKPQTNLTSQELMKFAWQIADGMSYLSSIPVLHRYLSARNVLVGEGKACKVADFGMARDVQEDNIYERKTRGRLPVKWTAIEALLYGKYSTKSDVWSYGILLYEIFTIGMK